MSAIAARLAAVQARVSAAELAAGREPGAARIVAVSKTFPAERVLQAVQAGARVFGENRVQEAAEKIPRVARATDQPLEWHLVGSLQRNKVARAIELFDVIHSIDRPDLAEALERAAERAGRRPRVLLQVNLDAEPQKAGVDPSRTAALAKSVAALPHLELAGLMAIPRPRTDPAGQHAAFARLRSLLQELKLVHAGLAELSMGMSADFEVAIAEGATWVRLGTVIFGERSAR
jgi:pyridoxal phosphate enzyme (YggS family)